MIEEICSPERCEYCIGNHCLKYNEPLLNDIKKAVMYHAFCDGENDLVRMWEAEGLKPLGFRL